MGNKQMLKKLFLSFTLALWVGSPSWATSPSSPQQKTMIVQMRISSETPESTLRTHLQIGDPARLTCMTLLGVKALMSGEDDKAEGLFKQILADTHPDTGYNLSRTVAFAALGIISTNRLEYTQGQQYTEQFFIYGDKLDLGYRPLVAELYAFYSHTLLDTGHLTEAQEALKKAFSLDPNCEPCQEVSNSLQAEDQAPDYFEALDKEIIRWNDNTHVIQVYLGTGEGLKDWNPAYITMAQTAFKKWEDASGKRFTFHFTSNQEVNDVRIHWFESVRPHVDGGFTTGLWHSEVLDSYLLFSDFDISLHDEDGETLSKDEIYSTLLHEIGHMLGLHGHSPNRADIMSTESMSNVITDRDIARTHSVNFC